MRAVRGLVRKHDAGLCHDLPVRGLRRAHEARVVVRVRQRDRALACGHGLDLVRVAALRRAGHVRHHALRPGLGLGLAQVRDFRADERQVVRMAARARADLALVLRIGERLVGRDVRAARPSTCCRRSRVHDTRSRTSCRRVAILRGNPFVQHGRLHGLEQAELLRPATGARRRRSAGRRRDSPRLRSSVARPAARRWPRCG